MFFNKTTYTNFHPDKLFFPEKKMTDIKPRYKLLESRIDIVISKSVVAWREN